MLFRGVFMWNRFCRTFTDQKCCESYRYSHRGWITIRIMYLSLYNELSLTLMCKNVYCMICKYVQSLPDGPELVLHKENLKTDFCTPTHWTVKTNVREGQVCERSLSSFDLYNYISLPYTVKALRLYKSNSEDNKLYLL